jgi:DNA-binding response OmpR family regulator
LQQVARTLPNATQQFLHAMQHTILAVDDEPEVLAMLEEYLGSRGYRVLTAGGAEQARAILGAEVVDLAILDINMPGEDGLSLARHLSRLDGPAIIMLTALDTVVDRVVGLEIGADDYIAKPFDLREVLARIKSVLRRKRNAAAAEQPSAPAGWPPPGQRARIGACILDLDAHRLLDETGAEIPLTSGEYDLLQVFVTHANRVLSRDQILSLTQHRGWDPFDRSVDIRVTRVRKKIEPNPDKPRFIKTIRGVGYMFVADGRD